MPARNALCPKQRATRQLNLKLEHARTFLEALGGDAVDVGLENGDSAHFAGPLVVPAAEPPHGWVREAPRLAAVQHDREYAARIQLPF